MGRAPAGGARATAAARGPPAAHVRACPLTTPPQPWEAKRDSRGRIVVDEEAGMKITSDV